MRILDSSVNYFSYNLLTLNFVKHLFLLVSRGLYHLHGARACEHVRCERRILTFRCSTMVRTERGGPVVPLTAPDGPALIASFIFSLVCFWPNAKSGRQRGESSIRRAMSSETTIESRCTQEIIRLHEFFVSWFEGTCPNTDDAFEGFASALSSGFSMIVPGGTVVKLPSLLERLRGAYAVHAEHGIKIEIRNVEILDLSNNADGTYFVRYEEWQQTGNPTKETARISTALLRECDGGPNNLSWFHVHETWMDGKGSSS